MMELIDYTTPVRTQSSMFCRVCGHFGWTADESRCPKCGAPLQQTGGLGTVTLSTPSIFPVESRAGNSILPLKANVILQFEPSSVCLSLPFAACVTLGRSSSPGRDMLDLTPFDAYRLGVSRQHCTLERHNSRLVLTDLGSANGTYLNGTLIPPGQGRHVAHGDTLLMGQLRCMVRFHTSPNH